MPIVHSICGTTAQGQTIEQYTLVNRNGLRTDILNWGATVRTLLVPDRHGNLGDIALGFDTYEPYLGEHPYIGSIVGRSANRIGDGRLLLDGKLFQLDKNAGILHSHGGYTGFDHRLWDSKAYETEDGPAVELHYFSPDGEERYPGNLDLTVVYTLTHENVLRIDYTATTDATTVVNLTNHTYFNFKGTGKILDHVLEVAASRFVEAHPNSLPTGNLVPVDGTPLDFRTPKPIGRDIDSAHPQIQISHGYDHCFVLDKPEGELGFAARATEPCTGRVVEIWTTEPGMQLYTGNFLEPHMSGKGHTFEPRTAFCLETQHFPDTPNHPNFPTTVLRVGETYRQTTEMRFLVSE